MIHSLRPASFAGVCGPFEGARDVACLSDNEVAALVCQALPADALAAAERHLDECPACFEAVSAAARAGDDSERATTTVVDGRASPGGERAPPATAPAGVLGRYVLLDPLGEGGMGRVFAAHDPQLSRRVAIKILREDLGSASDGVTHREFLQREARAMAQLAHPNVVAVHDVGVAGTQVFLAMELVDGVTLERWVAEQPRSTAEVLEVFLQAGKGLLAAHRAGIVHRDFKPRNVLVGRDGRVRVTDFGLARPVTESTRSALDTSGRGHVTVAAGTPAYMAPEQFDGAPASASSDQFSFCLSLYECLHGQLPFRKGRRVRPELLRPGRPVPLALEAALARGLSPEPADRFPELSALLDALDAARTAPVTRAATPVRPWGVALA
ncbi:MAG: serine/threonine protein kinase, partial [Myxococcaceae bacterium]|nr:serine/threonine protein kinase [Myxococcaceae bacterium]